MLDILLGLKNRTFFETFVRRTCHGKIREQGTVKDSPKTIGDLLKSCNWEMELTIVGCG